MIVTGFAEGIFDPGNPSRIARRDRKTDAEYVDALERAARAGVRVLAFRCLVTDTEIGIEGEIPVLL